MLADRVEVGGAGGVNATHRDYAEGLAVRFGGNGCSVSKNMLPYDYGLCQVKVVSAVD